MHYNATFSSSNFTNTIAHFFDAIILATTNHVLYSNRSATYASHHKYSEGLTDAKKIVEMKPDCPFGYAFSSLEMWAKLTADPTIRPYLQQSDFVKLMFRELCKLFGVLFNVKLKEKDAVNVAYKKDFDTSIQHYSKAIELNDEDISYIMNRATTYLEMSKRKRAKIGLQDDSKSFDRKGIALVKLAKCSKDYEPAIETLQKALTEHCNPGTLKKLNDAKKAKKELEQQEYFDPQKANEEREKGWHELEEAIQSGPIFGFGKKLSSVLGIVYRCKYILFDA
ncbi:hypothetical protein UlMin_004225 [Ulmus minor]